jgi:single-strand DNA-binding protein
MTYQHITIVGNVGKDAEIKYLRDGTAVADFSVAVSKVTGRGEQRKEKTTWFRVTVWRERAETAAQYIKKGMKILVVGEIDASAFIDKKSGEARASLDLTASNFTFLSPKGETQPEGGAPAYGNAGGGHAPSGNEPAYNEADDIPF